MKKILYLIKNYDLKKHFVNLLETIDNPNLENKNRITYFFNRSQNTTKAIINNCQMCLKDYAHYINNLPAQIILESEITTVVLCLASSVIGQKIITTYPDIIKQSNKFEMLSNYLYKIFTNNYALQITLDNLAFICTLSPDILEFLQNLQYINSVTAYNYCSNNFQAIASEESELNESYLKAILSIGKNEDDFNFMQEFWDKINNISEEAFIYILTAYSSSNNQQKIKIKQSLKTIGAENFYRVKI